MTKEQKTAEQLTSEAVDLIDKGKHEKAIARCNEAIKITHDDFFAFLLRGIANVNLQKRDEAKNDFNTAIAYAKGSFDKSVGFYYRGRQFFESGSYNEAENDYRKAMESDPSYKLPYYAKFILSAAKELFPNPKDKNAFSNLVVSLNNLLDTVLEIKDKHLLKKEDNACVEVAHFTKYETLKSMLPGKQPEGYEENCLRLYNVIYMNDPLEGRRLIEHDKRIGMNVLKNVFHSDDSHHKIHSSGKEFGVYISSLTLFSDKLYLWRAYGNDGNGYCIVTPTKEFRQEISSPMLDLGKENKPKERGLAAFMDLLNLSKFGNKVPPTLYKVLYKDEDVKETLESLAGPLKNVEQKRTALMGVVEASEGELLKAFHSLIRVILSEITFLYKHSEYAEENEVRIIHPFALSKEENGLHMDEQVPSRIYAKTTPFLFKEGSRIIIGPKVKEKVEAEHELKYRLAKNGFLEHFN